MSDERTMLRHTLATIAYRGGKALRDAPEGFGATTAGGGSRTAVQILAHMGDLFAWGLALADGEYRWSETKSDDWDAQVERFFAGLAAVDARLASPEPLGRPETKLLQGPFADALTHVGQIAMLRRVAGAPVRGENYFKATIEIGQVGSGQAPPNYEFD
ncbi:MAG: hypothetical protein O2958_06290 [Gemmatimonadetes bacterium]|nr:hypothetical protein [Gemmatimonadota bacterium]MDA1103063.1 hypothetical protein [Gemmatimonadota bacterium]